MLVSGVVTECQELEMVQGCKDAYYVVSREIKFVPTSNFLLM